jgi:hypothetical protein
MGLDMYLRASKFVSGIDYGQRDGEHYREENKDFGTLLAFAGLDKDDIRSELPAGTIGFTIAYWRKVNAIHQWFVDNCADGEDNCQPTYVSREKLEELRDLVHETRAERDPDLLPPQGGFFFGSTDIDEYYWKDLDETQEVLDKILSNPKFEGWDFEYQASW